MTDSALPDPLVPAEPGMRQLSAYFVLDLNLRRAETQRRNAGMFFDSHRREPERLGTTDGERRQERLRLAKEKGRHTHAEWIALCEEFNYRCVRCGDHPAKIEKDHVVPISLGGSDSITNLQPLCKRCNCSKREETKDWSEYRRLYGFGDNA